MTATSQIAESARSMTGSSWVWRHVGWAARRGPMSLLGGMGLFRAASLRTRCAPFRCAGLSSDLCRVRDGVRVDVVVACRADDQGLAPHFRHEGCPRGLAWPGRAEL